MATTRYLACDLGAESGRVMMITLEEKKLKLEEIYRFSNGAVRINGSLRWNHLRLFDEMKKGLRKAAALGLEFHGVSTNSWGVDYIYLHGQEVCLTEGYHYRDSRTEAYPKAAFATVPAETIFEETGIQFMFINTLYQLIVDVKTRPQVLELADRFLMVGDYYNWLFSGVGKIEVSMASTSQIYNPRTKSWSSLLIKKFGIPERLFPEIVASGTVLGPLTKEMTEETGLQNVRVIASCSHDTANAVVAVPGEGDDWAYLSSGTWSLLGVEVPEPVITPKSREYNFTNEVGYGHTIRFLKNISGLWLIQECRRAWASEGSDYNYDQITKMAAEALPLVSLVNPNDERFSKSGEMPRRIAEFCQETGQPVPETHGAMIRCCLESLALLYRRTLEQLEECTGKKIRKIHIVGGGSKNELLNQFSANATGREILAGPVEATAAGNGLVQALALGHLPDLVAARAMIRASFKIESYHPTDVRVWKTAYERFVKLVG